MDNSLGLDVHGTSNEPDAAGSEPAEPVEETVKWGVDVSNAEWGVESTSWGGAEPTSWGGAEPTSWGGESTDWGGIKEDPNEDPVSVDNKKKQEPKAKQGDKNRKEKGHSKPYVPASPAARAKMTPEELADRMEKIRLQNEKIKERRQHVKADEEAFNTSVAAERAKQAANRKVQAQINQNREQNAKRKLEKIGNREWDSGKQDGEWKQGKRPTEDKGRGNSFTLAAGGRDTGVPRTPTANQSMSKDSLSPSKEPVGRPLREAAPHAIQKDTDLSNSEAPKSEKQES